MDCQFTDRKTEAQRIRICPGLHPELVSELGLQLKTLGLQIQFRVHCALRILTWACLDPLGNYVSPHTGVSVTANSHELGRRGLNSS